MMDHQQASLLLSDLFEGRLDSRTASDVLAHLAECQECTTWSDTYGRLSEALEEEEGDAGEAHPSSEQIAVFAVEAEGIEGTDLARISAHIRACRDCSRELETTREAVAAARRPSRSFPGSFRDRLTPANPNFRAALAAGIVLGALAYPVYLGLYRLPEARGRAEILKSERGELEAEVRSLQTELDQRTGWAGPVGYLLLAGSTRGEDAVQSLKLRPGQPYVSIAVQPELPAGASGSDLYRFEIRTLDGRVTWQIEMPGSAIQQDLTTFEVVLFQIPSGKLPPDSYELRLFNTSSPSDLLIQARFGIEAPD